MSIIANAITSPDEKWGRYTVTAERMIDQARVFEEIAAGDDADRDAIKSDERQDYANWLEGRASAYRHAAKVIRRTVDMFAFEEISA